MAILKTDFDNRAVHLKQNVQLGEIAPLRCLRSFSIMEFADCIGVFEICREHEEALKEYAREKEEYELRRAAWKEQYKAASKKGNTVPDRPEDEPEEPKLRRLIVNDATFEALHQTMSENPAGILVNPG